MPRIASWIGVAVVAAAVAPALTPLDPTLSPIGEACTFGCLAGTFAFVALAGRRAPSRSFARVRCRRLLARSVVMTARSAQEEAIWRALLLGLLVAPLGRMGALVVSTGLFAAAHVRRQGRAACAHLATGAAFGLVYVVTGRLVAAIVAHAAYNLLVAATSPAARDMSVAATSAVSTRLVASEPPPLRLRSMHEDTRSQSAAGAPVARLEGVSKSFASVPALDGVDLELRRGEVLALLGPNGAGKSTAVSILLGLRKATAGQAMLFGHDPRHPAARRRVGAVLQHVGFASGLRVAETVDLVRAHFPDAASTTDVLARLGLATVARRDAAGLSGGQSRRLAVALALAGQPEALFLDEPTAGMDVTARRGLLADLRAFTATGGAVLLTTQQLAEAEEIATRVVLLVRGRVVMAGSIPEIRACAGRSRVTLRTPALPALRGATTVDKRGDRHVVYVDDADAYVSELVLSGTRFSELEVAPVSLEDAFVTLTSEPEP